MGQIVIKDQQGVRSSLGHISCQRLPYPPSSPSLTLVNFAAVPVGSSRPHLSLLTGRRCHDHLERTFTHSTTYLHPSSFALNSAPAETPPTNLRFLFALRDAILAIRRLPFHTPTLSSRLYHDRQRTSAIPLPTTDSGGIWI